MKSGKWIAGFIIFLILMYSNAGIQATPLSHNYTPLNSMKVQGAVNIEAQGLRKEKALILVNFTLGADTNGIFPMQEDINIGFMASSTFGMKEHCIVIHIPANLFEIIMGSFEIYESTNPADTGIKVFMVDEHSGEILKDLSKSLSFINSIISSVNDKGQYYLVIDAIFGHENSDSKSIELIASSTKSVLIIGDDIGSALAQNIEFQTP